MSISSLLVADTSIEDAILILPPKERHVVVEMRNALQEERNRNLDLEQHVRQLNTKIIELDAALQEEKSKSQLGTVSAAAGSNRNHSAHSMLHDTFACLKAQHIAAVDSVRRRTAEQIQTMDDTQFDAATALQNSVSRTLRPTPKTFEYVDMIALKNSVAGEGHAPSTPTMMQFVREFTDQIDAVRQCSRDSQHSFVHNDAVRSNLLRKIFDLCKTVEAKLGTTAHLNLPAAALSSMEIVGRDGVDATVRQREFNQHISSISHCGEVFHRCGQDIEMLEDLIVGAKNIPNFVPEFDAIAQQMGVDTDVLQRNEIILVEAGSLHIENFNAQRQTFLDECATKVEQIREHQVMIDRVYDDMVKLTNKAEDEYRAIAAVEAEHCKIQVDIARAEQRVISIRKAVESEVQKQRKFQEGAKFSSFLCHQAKDLFRKLHATAEEQLKQRKDFVERVKFSSQEQLYTMAEVLHDILSKRIQNDTQRMRLDHQALEAGNRALMSLVHSPPEMEKQMQHIRELTNNVGAAKQRIASTNADIAQLRSVLVKYGTMQFLKRDSNFLSIHDGQERLQKTREKVEDGVQRLKYVAEILVEISDPDTRQDYVVAQCLDALKVSVSDMNDLASQRHLILECDEGFRQSALSRMKRHYSLVSHFLQQMHDGVSDLALADPSIESNCATLVNLMDQVRLALQGEQDEFSKARQRQLNSSGRMGGSMPMMMMTMPMSQNQLHQHQYQHQQMMSLNNNNNHSNNNNSFALSNMMMMGAGANGMALPGPGGVEGSQPSMVAAYSSHGGGGGGGSPPNPLMPQQQQSQQQQHLIQEPVREIIDEHHAFARASSRLKISADQRRIIKPPGGIELSNTSALGSVGFRYGTGVHSFCIRIGHNCTRLLVGAADWNLPLDGYCNSLKYGGCYYLHIGGGTLWAPDMKYERKPYTHHAIGNMAGAILRCIVDTENCAISFAINDVNLGVAFKNVPMTRTLYPAFEMFSSDCSFEFCDDPRLALSMQQGMQH